MPFALLGLLIIVLFYRSAKQNNDKAFRWMWLTIVLSFGFYIPVVLWANAIPMIGMLMIPKTCAYVWTVLIGYSAMKKECKVELCASHGLLSQEDFNRLKEAGVGRYHANIETSRRNFPNICTTHTFEDKLEVIRRAQAAGLSVCSGGIIGMGETWEDRIDMAITLSELGIKSIPINILRPIPGTPLEHQAALSENEILRTIAIFRYINPTAMGRLAAGRNSMEHSGERAFRSGANAAITGDMLTTSGNRISEDQEMLAAMGFTL